MIFYLTAIKKTWIFSGITEAKPTKSRTVTNLNFLIRCSFIVSLSTNISQRQISASSALLEAHWESVCWALLKQQRLGRWARVTMSLCLFWDQLRQYSQVRANFICATYKNIFLQENIHAGYSTQPCTNFIFLSTYFNSTFLFVLTDFLSLLETGATLGPKSSSPSSISTVSCVFVLL